MKRGFTLVEILIVVVIVGLLAVIAIPQWQKYRAMARTNCCIANLRQIDHAKAEWAFDARRSAEDVPTMTDLLPYMQNERAPVCPAGGWYDLRSVSEAPSCSLSAEGHVL